MQVKNKGFTIMELMIVGIIIGVLATISIAYYTSVKENVADREANSNLKNIQVAEKSYFLDHGAYHPEAAGTSDSNISNINVNLKLSLPTAAIANRDWDYIVFSTGCARAIRNDAGARNWFLAITDGTAVGTDGESDAGAGCP